MNSEQEIERIEEIVEFWTHLMGRSIIRSIDRERPIKAPPQTPIPEVYLREFKEEKKL